MTDANKSEQETDNPLAGVQKSLTRMQLLAGAGILLCVGLFAASVAVMVYSGFKSMAAFEELPKYRVNTLVLAYREAAQNFDHSVQETESKLAGTPAQFTLSRARQLSAQALDSEQIFASLLSEYAVVMGSAAEQTGGALEWNRHFQANLEQLYERSEARQIVFKAMIAEFPAPLDVIDEKENKTH